MNAIAVAAKGKCAMDVRRQIRVVVCTVAVLGAAGGIAGAEAGRPGHARPMSPRDVVDSFDNLILAHKPREAIERFIAPDFVEHDPLVAVDGREGLLRYMHDHGWESGGNTEM